MKKLILFFSVICILSATKAIAEDKNQSVLNEYLAPAEITKLDWILLEIKIDSFNDPAKLDDLGVVETINIFPIESKPAIGMTFSINKNKYLTFKNNLLEKIFTDVVKNAFRIIKIKLPKINLEKDIYANFVTIEDDSKVVAEFENGKVSFINTKL